MENTFCIQNPMVCTTGNILTIGEKYMYKEGAYIAEVILKAVRNTEEFLYFDLYFCLQDKTIQVFMKHGNFGFSGMNRLWDHSRLELYKDEMIEWEERNKPNQPEPDFSACQTTCAQYIATLTEEQIDKLIIHFNTLYICPELSVHEQRMTWLAWLLGEKQYIPDPDFEIIDMTVGGFKKEDFAITFESEDTGKIDFGFLKAFYRLDEMYENILKNDIAL